MVAVSQQWYRIVGKPRVTRHEVLQSRSGRFHDDAERQPTSYVADSLQTAWREVAAAFGNVSPNPDAFRAWRVTLLSETVLVDLRDPVQQAELGITADELQGDPAPPSCKEVARKLRRKDDHPQGLIYRSVRHRPDGVCVVLFLELAEDVIVLEPVTDEEWDQFLRDAGLRE